MPNYNELTIIGHLGKDPQSRQAGGKTVVNFTVAVNMGGQQNKTTQWFEVSAWEKTGDIAMRFLKKGAPVMVVGPVELHKYTGNNNQEYTSLRVNAYKLVLLGAKEDSGGQQYSKSPHPEHVNRPDDIPF